MRKYDKIETLFIRDTEGTKKLIEGHYRNKHVSFLCDNKWCFTEKIDGTNIGVVWDGHSVSFQGRTERAEIPKPLLERLGELFGSQETEELFEQLFGEKEVILYGEGFGGKIQKGANYQKEEDFILFDVYYVNSDIYVEREQVEEIGKAFGIKVVPIHLYGTINEAVKYIKSRPKSMLSEDARFEGVVGRPLVELKDAKGQRIIVKIKVVDFA